METEILGVLHTVRRRTPYLKEDAICGSGGKYGGEENAYRVLVRKRK